MKIIKGHYRQSGGSLEIGTLMVGQRADGSFFDALEGGTLKAVAYKVTDGITGIEITSARSVFEFLPDAGECARVGIPVGY